MSVFVHEKLLPMLRPMRPLALRPARRACRRCLATLPTRECHQQIPLGAYYENILRNAQRLPGHAGATSNSGADAHFPMSDPRAADEKTKTPLDTTISFDTSPPAPPPTADASTATATVTTAEEKFRIVFGSRLLGPAERGDHAEFKKAQSTWVAGVLVPPRPEEPDNCCMSGCINCVWDRFGEDLEEWTAKKTEAENLLRAMGGGVGADAVRAGEMARTKTKEELEEEAFSDVPAGIREFIKMEKRMRERHEHEIALG